MFGQELRRRPDRVGPDVRHVPALLSGDARRVWLGPPAQYIQSTDTAGKPKRRYRKGVNVTGDKNGENLKNNYHTTSDKKFYIFGEEEAGVPSATSINMPPACLLKRS